jgi:hypothetical protein
MTTKYTAPQYGAQTPQSSLDQQSQQRRGAAAARPYPYGYGPYYDGYGQCGYYPCPPCY